MVAMWYVELKLKKKMDWRMLLTRRKMTECSTDKEMCMIPLVLHQEMLK
jgi:hypothetical protein